MIREDLIFERSIKFGIKNKVYITLILIFEYISIFIESLTSMTKIISSNTKLSSDFDGFLVYANYISPYHIFKKIIKCNQNSSLISTIEVPETVFITIFIISFLFFFSFFVNCCYQEAKEKEFDFGINEKTSLYKFSDSLNYLFINYFEIYFHVMGMCFLFLNFNVIGSSIVNLIKNSMNINQLSLLIYILLTVIFLTYFLIFNFKNVNTINIMLQFNSKLSHHYDSLFSRDYNFFLLYLKIIISIENNLSILMNTDNSYQLIFINFIIVISIFTFIFVKMINVFSGNLIFLSNVRCNLLRIVLLTVNSIFLVIIGIFNEEMKDLLMSVITFIGMIFVAFYNRACVRKLVEEGLAKNSSLIYQIIYILNLKQIKTQQELQSEISHVFLIHKLNCKISADLYKNLEEKNYEYDMKAYRNAPTISHISSNISSNIMSNINSNFTENTHVECLICNQEDYTYQNFLTVYIKQIKYNIKNRLEQYTKMEMEYYTLLKLIFLEQIEEEKIVKLIYKTKIALDVASKNKTSFYWNLIIFNKYIKMKTPENIIKKFLIMKKYDETNLIIEKSIDLIDELYVIFDTHVEKEIYEISKKLNSYKKEIGDNINMFARMKNFYTENYTLILIKYLYENVFNSCLKGINITDEMQDLEELMSFHFNYDNIIKINLNIEQNAIKILKASKDLIDYSNKNFEEMIPKKFRKIAKNKFIKMVKENNSEKFVYEFIILKNIDDIHISYLKMDCIVSLSMDLKELLIIGEYNIEKEEIIMFEEEKDSEVLVSYSKNINKFLFIPPNCLSNLKNCKLFFTFDNIFEIITYTKKDLKLDSTANNSIKHFINDKRDVMNFYKIDYSKYLTNYLTIMRKLLLLDNQEDEDLFQLSKIELNLSEELRTLAKDRTVISVSLTRKQTIKKNLKTYIIYAVKKIDFKKMMNDEDDPDTYLLNLENFEYDDLLTMHGSSSGKLSKSSATFSVNRMANEKFNNNEFKNSSELNQITIATSVLSFIFIIYCVVFLSLSMINKNKIQDSYLLRNSFNDMKTNFYETCSSLLNNFELYEYNSTNISANQDVFINNLANNKNVTIDFKKFIKNEIAVKLSILQKSINDFQQAVISSTYKDKVDFIFSEITDYYRISQISGDITLYKNTNLFFTSLKMYLNNVQVIINNETINVFLYILTLKDGEAQFDNIFDKNLKPEQIYAYEIILNYVNLYHNFETLGTNLSDLHLSNINEIFAVSFYLTFIIMGLHVTLIILCCCIIRYLNRIINRNSIIINELLIFANLRYMRSKMAIFRNLNEMYRENPRKLFTKFKRIRTNFLCQKDLKNEDIYQRENVKKIYINNTALLKKAKYNINNMLILKPIFISIIVLFALYYSFNTLFYFIQQSSKEELIFSSEASESNIQIYSTILNNLNLLQIMIFTNVSDRELNYIFHKTEDTGYLLSNNDWALKKTFEMYSLDTISSQFSIISDYQTKLNDCGYIYSNLNDTIYNTLKNDKKFANTDNLDSSLTSICNMYPVMKNKNIKYITAELNYITKDLLFRYETARLNYTKMKEIYEDYSRYNLYVLINLILRPIQTYINYTLNYISVKLSETNYLTITIIYLTLNIFIDFILFYVINNFIVKHVLNINSDLSAFINIIKK